MFQRWYFEAEIGHIEQITPYQPHLRMGWACASGYVPYPGPSGRFDGSGVGDDLHSWGFDGLHMWTGKGVDKIIKLIVLVAAPTILPKAVT